MGQHNQAQGKKAAESSIGEVKKAQRHPFGEKRKEQAAEDAGNNRSCSTGQAHYPRRGPEIITDSAQQVGQRE